MILITRPIDLAERTAEKLRQIGHKFLIHPLLEIKSSGIQLKDSGYKVIVVTSQNAAKAIAQHDWIKQKQVFTVGDATAEILKQNDFEKITSAKGDVNQLLELVKTIVPTSYKVLYACGDHTAGNLFEKLTEEGYAVDKEVVYHSMATTSAPNLSGIDTVLFYSPRTATIFKELCDDVSGKTAVCISQNTADNISDMGWKEIKVAEAPNEESLLELLNEK